MTDIAFIVGKSAGSIDDEARRTHGWQRMSVTTWRDTDGQTVIYLHDPIQLSGAPQGLLVYLAYGFDQRDNWSAIDDMMRRRDCERIDLNELQ